MYPRNQKLKVHKLFMPKICIGTKWNASEFPNPFKEQCTVCFIPIISSTYIN